MCSRPFAPQAWAAEKERRNEQLARRLPLTKVSYGWHRSKVEIALGDPLHSQFLSPVLLMLPSWRYFDM